MFGRGRLWLRWVRRLVKRSWLAGWGREWLGWARWMAEWSWLTGRGGLWLVGLGGWPSGVG